MAVARCIQCQAELPEAGRFCVMCGRRVGHAVRDRSSDRRVYTSVVGHSVPPEVVLEFERHSGELSADETAAAKREITARTAARAAAPRDGALSELWRSLIWALVLSTLGALVAWGVYAALRRNAPVPPVAAPESPRPPAPRAPISRPRPPSPPPAKPAPGRELIIPVPGTAPPPASVPPAGTAPPPSGTAPAGTAPPPAPSAGAALARQNNDIDFVASQHSPQVRACYDRAFRHAGDKAPTGRVELSFVLVDNGTFGQAREIVTELNLLGEPLVAACLEELVAEWHFPRPPPAASDPLGSPVRRLRYPFVFTAAPIQ